MSSARKTSRASAVFTIIPAISFSSFAATPASISATANYQRTLSAHGDVLEAIRMRRVDDAHEQMKALIGIASLDLLEVANGAGNGRSATRRV